MTDARQGDPTANSGEHPIDQLGAVFGPPQLRQQQGELVAAKAGDGIMGTHDTRQGLGDLDQELVSSLMAIGVIERLEAVEIQIAERQRPAAPIRTDDGPIERWPDRDGR
jgi:hypothetical protein